MRTIQSSGGMVGDHWLNIFQKYLSNQDLSPFTIRGYIYDLEHFRSWLKNIIEHEPILENVTTVDIAAYRQHMVHDKRMKPSSVNRRIQAVKRLFLWAVEHGLAKENPAQNVRFMKPSARYRPKALQKKEVYALLRVAGQSPHGMAKRNYAFIQLLIQTGARIGEAASLKVTDIQISNRAGHINICDAKGHKERQVPLNVAARRAITTYLNTRSELVPDEFLFLTKRNKQASVRTLQNIVSHLARKAHIKRIKVSAHTLRHTFATNFLKAHPGKLVELSNLMGHESLDTVALYTRPSQESLAQDLESSPINVY